MVIRNSDRRQSAHKLKAPSTQADAGTPSSVHDDAPSAGTYRESPGDAAARTRVDHSRGDAGGLELRIGGLLQRLARLGHSLVERRNELRARVQWSGFVPGPVFRRDIQLVKA